MHDWIDVRRKKLEDIRASEMRFPHQCASCKEWLLDVPMDARCYIHMQSVGLLFYVCDDCVEKIVPDWAEEIPF